MYYLTKNIIAKILTLAVISTIFIISCNSDGIPQKEFEVQYYKESQLKNIYDNEIAPLNAQFIIETTLLNDIVEQFQKQPTLQNLEKIQNQWASMLKVWKQVELYNIGPIADSFIHFKINRWPSNLEFINNFIDGTEILNEAFIASKGSSSKGISAIEYFVFTDSKEATLNSFTIGANYERRLNYLVAVSQNLKTKAHDLEVLWMNYKPTFIATLENGTSGSQNQITNAMVGLIEEIIISKLGRPLGDHNGGEITIKELEALESSTSLLIIKQHLIALERCYSGEFAQTPFRIGYSDYLIQLGYSDLSTSIFDAFSNCQNAIEKIEFTLKYELENNPQNVLNLRTSFRDLLVLIKVDMANAIGSTITFNDNDGD